MTFTIDATVDLMVSGLKNNPYRIISFQRDGDLYLLGHDAVAIVRRGGIDCSPRTDGGLLTRYVDKDKLPKANPPWLTKEGKLTSYEKSYFTPLVRNEDGSSTSLKQLMEIRKKLIDLPADGNIRMIDHSSSYHSHKYGYACDGEDVFMTDTRVMNLSEYLDLMRMKELRSREEIGTKDSDGYAVSSVPAVAVLTPHALISFPFEVHFDRDRERSKWNNGTPLEGNIFDFRRINSSSDESIYGFYLTLNGMTFGSSKPEDFEKNYSDHLNQLELLKGSFTPLVKSVVDELNALHNERFAEEINYWKEFREKSRKNK